MSKKEECDCLNWCGDDQRIRSRKVKPCKQFMLGRLEHMKPGTPKERQIVAMIGREVIRLKHKMNLFDSRHDAWSKVFYGIKLTEYHKAKTLYIEAKAMLGNK